MKNSILAFIYRDLSDEKKEELTALAEVEEEEEQESQKIHDTDYSSLQQNQADANSTEQVGQEGQAPSYDEEIPEENSSIPEE